MNSAAIEVEVNRIKVLLERSTDELGRAVHLWAEKERDYRKAKAQAYDQVKKSQVKLIAPERQALVDAMTADARFDRDDADGQKMVLVQSLQNLRQQLSAIQTIAGLHKAEMDLAR